jgi:hypothetical protein
MPGGAEPNPHSLAALVPRARLEPIRIGFSCFKPPIHNLPTKKTWYRFKYTDVDSALRQILK